MLLTLLAAAAVATGHTEGLPAKAPKSVGMSAERLATIDRVILRGITAGGFPGASVIVGRKGATVVSKGFGHLGWTKDSPVVLPDRTIYDLASLTKVVGTTTAAMVLFDEGKLALDEKVTHYVPGFTGGLKDSVTVRQLLMHRGGLPAGRDLWRHAHTPEEARQMVLDVPLEYKPGTGFIYSDLGADILGMVVESASGERLDAFLQERVFGPLGMTDTGFRPADSLVYRIAPTEVSPPRGYPLRGEVHDENAFALGGVAGHAGLFGTASDLAVFAQMMLNGGSYDGTRIIADSTIKLFTARAAGSRALGWEVGEGHHGAGAYLGENAFGHTGFTGTSMWIDPEREMFVILLTNRVHAAKARRPAKVISDVRADLADAAALAVTDENLAVTEMPASFRADREVGWNRPMRKARPHRGTSGKSKAKTSAEKGAGVKRAVHKSSVKSASAKRGSSKKLAAGKKSAAARKPVAKKNAD
ncbi:MAG: serine hydrolase [Gemmatimonadetes bacterium]|nr:serine hydrolase [Gemmatimonadota bacterium]MBI3569235.1 serine hydrolase [Gemmatimonadota bacterium]